MLEILLAMSAAFARENLYEKPKISEAVAFHEKDAGKQNALRSRVGSSPRPNKTINHVVIGNLDSEIMVSSRYRVEDAGEIIPKQPVSLKFKGLKVGEVLNAEITEEVTVYPDSKTPVRATVTLGRHKGSVLLGEASLEKNSKKVLINFKQFRPQKSDELYQLAGYSLVEGDYHTNEPKFFVAEFLAAGAAGFADASIERNQNVLGNYVEESSLDTTGKKALGSALNKSAERFAEKNRSAPEFTVLNGQVSIEILITDQPQSEVR